MSFFPGSKYWSIFEKRLLKDLKSMPKVKILIYFISLQFSIVNCNFYKNKKSSYEFKREKNPVLYGVVNALFLDSPTSCVLLGQRNVEQVKVASSLGDILSSEDTNWVKSLYNN